MFRRELEKLLLPSAALQVSRKRFLTFERNYCAILIDSYLYAFTYLLTDLCTSGDVYKVQAVSHIVDHYSLTRLESGLVHLHMADDAALIDTWHVKHANNN